MCVMLMLVATSALAQKFTGVIEQQSISIPSETLIQISGEIFENPTPEQEAYGYDPQKILGMTTTKLLAAAKQSGGSYSETTTMIYVSSNAIRVDLQTPMDKMSNVMRHDKGVIWIIMHGQKKYVEMTSKDLEQTLHGMKGAGKTMGHTGAAANRPAESASKKTGERVTINGFACERYISKGAEGIEETWITSQLGDLRTVFEEVTEGIAKAMKQQADDEDEIREQVPEGVPILTRELSPGSDLSIQEIKSIKRQPVEARLFEIPDGYQKVTMAEMMKMQMEQERE